MGGIFGGFTDILMGEIDKPKKSDIWTGAGDVGHAVRDDLLDLFRGEESQQFKLGREALSESVTRFGRGQRQQLSDRALAGGFFDSGAMHQGMSDIDRAELQAFSSGIRDLLIQMEDRKFQFAFPFLAGASGEHSQIEGLKLQGDVAERGQNIQFMTDLLSSFMPMAGGA